MGCGLGGGGEGEGGEFRKAGAKSVQFPKGFTGGLNGDQGLPFFDGNCLSACSNMETHNPTTTMTGKGNSNPGACNLKAKCLINIALSAQEVALPVLSSARKPDLLLFLLFPRQES